MGAQRASFSIRFSSGDGGGWTLTFDSDGVRESSERHDLEVIGDPETVSRLVENPHAVLGTGELVVRGSMEAIDAAARAVFQRRPEEGRP